MREGEEVVKLSQSRRWTHRNVTIHFLRFIAFFNTASLNRSIPGIMLRTPEFGICADFQSIVGSRTLMLRRFGLTRSGFFGSGRIFGVGPKGWLTGGEAEGDGTRYDVEESPNVSHSELLSVVL